jgi:hypothetical protein
MAKVKEDKIIGTFAVIGYLAVLALVIAATIKWVDPFLSFDANGDPTIFGRLFVYGLYFVESLAALLGAWLSWLAFWSFIPRRKTKMEHIKHIPLDAPINVTGRTSGVN